MVVYPCGGLVQSCGQQLTVINGNSDPAEILEITFAHIEHVEFRQQSSAPSRINISDPKSRQHRMSVRDHGMSEFI